MSVLVDQNRQRERKKRAKKRENDETDDEHTSSDDDPHESGTGILEFSPDKAGLDVTPANYNFGPSQPTRDKRHSTTLAGIAGNLPQF